MTELQQSLAGLAGTADRSPSVDAYFRQIVEYAPRLVGPVDAASITVSNGTGFATVASSAEEAVRIDEAQYRERTGPCLQALDGTPVAVPDLDAAGPWPQFREQARSLGLFAALSIPLFAASGAVIASLNLYAREPAAMRPLIDRVVALYREGAGARDSDQEPLGDGGEHLLDALVSALRIHDEIQHALGMLISAGHRDAAGAYAELERRAQARGAALHDEATLIRQDGPY